MNLFVTKDKKVAFSLDHIIRIEQFDNLSLTKVYMSDGHVYTLTSDLENLLKDFIK